MAIFFNHHMLFPIFYCYTCSTYVLYMLSRASFPSWLLVQPGSHTTCSKQGTAEENGVRMAASDP